MNSAFLGYMQEANEKEEIIRKMMKAYRAGKVSCKISSNNYFSPKEIDAMKQEAMRRVHRTY